MFQPLKNQDLKSQVQETGRNFNILQKASKTATQLVFTACFFGVLVDCCGLEYEWILPLEYRKKILPKQKTKPKVKTNSVKNYWGQTHHVVPSWYESKISQKKGLGNIFVWRQAHMKSWRYQLSSVQRFLTDHLKWMLSLECGYAYIYIYIYIKKISCTLV